MTLKDLWKVYPMYDIILYVNRELIHINSDFELAKYNDCEVMKITPICVVRDGTTISNGITVNPYLEIYLRKKD